MNNAFRMMKEITFCKGIIQVLNLQVRRNYINKKVYNTLHHICRSVSGCQEIVTSKQKPCSFHKPKWRNTACKQIVHVPEKLQLPSIYIQETLNQSAASIALVCTPIFR